MNKTVYLREEEVPLWEKARELSGDKLSPVIVSALRRYVAETEANARSFERIVVEYCDKNDNGIPKAKAFYGKWIIPPDGAFFAYADDALEDEAEDFEPGTAARDCVAAAVSSKGVAVFYSWRSEAEGREEERLQIFPNLASAAYDWSVGHAAKEAIKRQGVPVEELDI